ncbi:hypothetical protein [Paenibacillus taichungensis]
MNARWEESEVPRMQKIRTKQVEGTTTPEIIHNGGHHFLIPVQIYG